MVWVVQLEEVIDGTLVSRTEVATLDRTFRTPARPSRRIFLTHIRLDIARDFWHATLQRAG